MAMLWCSVARLYPTKDVGRNTGVLFPFSRIRYRLWQFWQALRARPLSPADWDHIQAVLSPAEVKLFCRLLPGDQDHSYRVMRTLQAAGYHERHLLAAALLHDVGKTKARLFLWDRAWGVLGQQLWPGRAAVWGQAEPRGWRKAFVVQAQHAAWGAQMARAAGSSPVTVALIGRHQDNPRAETAGKEEELLRRL